MTRGLSRLVEELVAYALIWSCVSRGRPDWLGVRVG